MSDYDIYREELAIKHPAYGHALWEPNPGGHYTSVEIGDVGFIRQGYFHRMFNILLPEDHPSHQDGVPAGHEPLLLRVASHTSTGNLQRNNLRSSGVADRSDEHRLGATGPDEAAEHSFSCFKKRGAILSLPLPAQRTDTAARGDFARCIVRHIDDWFAFAQQGGLGVNREDIILVTGCHLAKSWATIAFHSRGEQIAFGVRATGDSDVTWQFTPEGAQGVPYNLGPSGKGLPENQCIFIRGFRAGQFSKIMPTRLRGAAEPEDPDYDSDPSCDKRDTQIPNVPTDTSYQDPLCTLMDYVFSQAPECEIALIHDDDLGKVCGSSTLESLRPDVLMGHLQTQAPLVQMYTCDLPPTGKSETKAPSVTVATLSKFNIADAFKPVVASEVEANSVKSPPPATTTLPKAEADLVKSPPPATATLPKDEANLVKSPPQTAVTLPKSEANLVTSPPQTPAALAKPEASLVTSPPQTPATLAKSEAKLNESPPPPPAALPKSDSANESKPVVSPETTSHSDKGTTEAKTPSPPAPTSSTLDVAVQSKPASSAVTAQGKTETVTQPPPAATPSKLDKASETKTAVSSEIIRRESTITEAALTEKAA